MRTTILLAALTALLTAAATPAHAAEDPREVQGRALYAKGDYQAALDLYARLFAEKGDPIYLRNVGRCNQKLRRPDHAIDAFRDYLRRGRNIRPAERTEIEGYIKEMEALKAVAEKEREKEKEREAAAQAREREREAAAQAREREREREATVRARDRERETTAQAREQSALAREQSAQRERDAAARDQIEREQLARAKQQASESAGSSTAGTGAPPVVAATAPTAHAGQSGTFFMALAIGTGIGIASGRAELNPSHNVAVGGFSPAQLGHAAPEIGVFVLPRLLLSAQLRLQYVAYVNGQNLTDVCGTGQRYCRPSALGIAGFGRIAWLAGNGAVHLMPGLAVGGGNIRHAQEYPDDRMCGEQGHTSCVDTVASGPFLFGPSVGLLIELGDTVGLLAAVNMQLGAPKFTINFDFNAGLTFRL